MVENVITLVQAIALWSLDHSYSFLIFFTIVSLHTVPEETVKGKLDCITSQLSCFGYFK